MAWWHAILLGIVEGITEFLPISSSGHLTIIEKLLGYQVDDLGITAFTAIIQLGAIAAAILYFRVDIWRVLKAWLAGLFNRHKRAHFDYRFGWAIIIGCLPIALLGLIFKDQIETIFRSLWIVAIALIGWSFVMWLADKIGTNRRPEKSINWKDTLIIGLAQCLALIPGVSRSGATISAGLFRGLNRVSATRLSFFLGIPALSAAGILQAVTQHQYIEQTVGWWPTALAIGVSFIVGYLAIAWLLKFISNHNFNIFVCYRLVVGGILLLLLFSGTISAV